ncbi:uncharacterized protein DSM5745_01292 [Aspergillus mulundensis]|uniref:Uncharacterized protein n=1 Tax=Aspergillus mulundensis TaxID=1810919 RepID=A0A3D8T618_9EURO|nr:hypothetical protein DSM5745_01292 [Aspergillus mulundensis]RDW93970.1 hypothetical protein DSM5745_01292 [Aspergillus mulundensis]
MPGLLARVPLAALLLLWLCLALQSDAVTKRTANMYAHAYERIWLWERYQMAIAMQTKDKSGKLIEQREILPMNHVRGGDDGIKNRHWIQATNVYTENEPLHYNEFMLRVGGVSINDSPNHIPPDITAPSGVDDLERAAEELVDNRLSDTMEIAKINDKFGQTGGGGKVNKAKKGQAGKGESRRPTKEEQEEEARNREDARYQRFIKALDDQLKKWRTTDDYSKIKERDTLMKTVTDRVVKLRIEDGQRFMLNYFTGKNNLGLDGKVETDKNVKSAVPGGPEYERLDLVKTWEEHKDDVKAAISKSTGGKVVIKTKKDFVKWVTEFGDPAGTFAKANAANPSHFQTIEMWKSIDENNPC